MELDVHAWGDQNGVHDSSVVVENMTVSRYLAVHCATLYVGTQLTVKDSLEIDRGALVLNEGAKCLVEGDLKVFGGESPENDWAGDFTVPAGAVVTVGGSLSVSGTLTVDGTLKVGGELHASNIVGVENIEFTRPEGGLWYAVPVTNEQELRDALTYAEELNPDPDAGSNNGVDIIVVDSFTLESSVDLGNHANLSIDSRWDDENGRDVPFILTVGSGATLTLRRHMQVDGTLVVNGALQNNAAIDVNGSIELNGSYDGYGELTVHNYRQRPFTESLRGFDMDAFYLVWEDEEAICLRKLDPEHDFTDLSDLPAIIAQAEAHPDRDYHYNLRWANAMPPTFEESITIPANLSVNLNGDAFIAPGVTVTVNGSLSAARLALRQSEDAVGSLVIGEGGYVGLTGEIVGDSLENLELVQINAENEGTVRYHFEADSQEQFYITMAVLPTIAAQAAEQGAEIWVTLIADAEFYWDEGLIIPENVILELCSDWRDNRSCVGRLNVYGQVTNHGQIRIETDGESTLTAESYEGFGRIEVCVTNDAPIESPWSVLLGGFDDNAFFVDPFQEGRGWNLQKLEFIFRSMKELEEIMVPLTRAPENGRQIALTYVGGYPFEFDDVTLLAGYSVCFEGDVIVPAGVTVTVADYDYDHGVYGAELNVDGTLTVQGTIDNYFWVTVHYYNQGWLTLDGGTMTGYGAICALTGSENTPTTEDLGFDLSDYAMHYYNAPSDVPAWEIFKPTDWFLSFDELRYIVDHMEEGEERDVYYAAGSDRPFTFEESIELPAGLHLQDFYLTEVTIPEGVTVTVNDELFVDSLRVDGTLQNNGFVETFELTGERNIQNGVDSHGNTARVVVTFWPFDTAEARTALIEAAALAERYETEGVDVFVEVEVGGELELETVNLPSRRRNMLKTNAAITAEHLTVDGVLELYGASFTVTKTLQNNGGEIQVGVDDGVPGRLELADGAVFSGWGRVMVEQDISATGFTGYDPARFDVTQEEYHGSSWDVFIYICALGDVNGDGRINTADLLRLLKYLTNFEVPVFCDTDLDHSGETDANDLLHLLRFVNGQIASL